MTSESDNGTQPIDVQPEKNFLRFLENLSCPSVIHSNGKYVYANKAAAKLYKAPSPKALIGKNTLDIIDKDFKKVTRERIKEVYERGFTPERENLIVDKEGKTIIVQIAGTLIDYKGNPSVLFTLQNLAGERKAEEELQVSESQYRLAKTKEKKSKERYLALVNNMNEGVLQVDNDENIEYVNNRFCDMLGYKREELVGQNANKLFSVSSNDSKTMKYKVSERQKGLSSRYELQMKTKSRGVIWVNASGAPVYDGDGKVIGSIGINTDITQRKKVEAEMESLSRFPRENPFPVLRFSVDQRVFIYNNNPGESIIKHLALKKNMVLNKHWEDLFETSYKHNKTVQEELLVNSVLYMCNIVPVQKSNYVNVYMSDITEERAAEEALLDSEEKFRSLVENMNEGVIRINVDDTIEYVNESFCKILGYSQKELLGKNRFDVLTIDDDSMKEIEKSIAKRKKGVSSKYELKHKRKSGEWIWVSINGTPLHDDKGVMVGSMGIVADITNQKRFEEEINELNMS